jgi:hypothetical protein
MRPSKQPPSAQVSEFMSHYGIESRLGRPRERILTWMARLQPVLQPWWDVVALTEEVLSKNLRATLFYLEGILKLYVRRYPELEPLYRRVKSLEDVLGGYDAAQALVQTLSKLDVSYDCTAWAEQQRALMRQRITDELSQGGWVVDGVGRVPLFGELITALTQLDFEGYRKDRKTLIREIRRRLSLLDKTSMDMFELQGNRGLHELRRQLRWVPIYCVALDGLIVIDPTFHPIKEYAQFLDAEVAKSPYARLPEPTFEDEPVRISSSLFLANTHFIAELGDLKDSGETVEGVEHALLGSGVVRASVDAHREALRLLGRSPEEQFAIHVLAEKLYKELRKKRFIRHLRADFKR